VVAAGSPRLRAEISLRQRQNPFPQDYSVPTRPTGVPNVGESPSATESGSAPRNADPLVTSSPPRARPDPDVDLFELAWWTFRKESATAKPTTAMRCWFGRAPMEASSMQGKWRPAGKGPAKARSFRGKVDGHIQSWER
jgi:hypothetical protein